MPLATADGEVQQQRAAGNALAVKAVGQRSRKRMLWQLPASFSQLAGQHTHAAPNTSSSAYYTESIHTSSCCYRYSLHTATLLLQALIAHSDTAANGTHCIQRRCCYRCSLHAATLLLQALAPQINAAADGTHCTQRRWCGCLMHCWGSWQNRWGRACTRFGIAGPASMYPSHKEPWMDLTH